MGAKKGNRLKRNDRLRIIYAAVIFFGLLCLLKILHLVFWQRALYSGTSKSCLDKTKPGWDTTALAKAEDCKCTVIQNNIKPTRGEIYDDQGRLLVGNYAIFDITIDGRVLKPKEYTKGQKKIVNDTIYCGNGRKISRSGNPEMVDALVNELATAFYQMFHDRFKEKSLKYYKERFTKAIKDQKNVLILTSNHINDNQWITSEDTAAIAKLPLLCRKQRGGLHYDIAQMRINPYGELAKRTLGMYYIPKDTALTPRIYGIEAAFNDYLAGINGAQKALYVNNARIPLNDRTEPVDGYDVITTINLEMQNIAHTELQKILMEYQADWGCAVVMETKTGEVKAIANLRANKDKTSYYEGEKNYALKAMVEPGSTFKLASLLAYLERTPIDSVEEYPILIHRFTRKSKSGKVFTYLKYDEKGKDSTRVAPIIAFQRSSNVGIASMVFDKYSKYSNKPYLNKIDSMSITTSFSTQLGQVEPPNILRKANDFHSYYNLCFGTGFTMPPIRTLVYFNAVANGGKMIAPIFVKSIIHHEDTIAKFQAEVISEQICKKSTIDRAKKYLEAVVTGPNGTARTYRDPNFNFAGKTGTRDIWDTETQSYLKNKNSVSFCGYFPAEDPKYTCLVFIYNVSKKSSIAVKVFANIARQILEQTKTLYIQDIDTSNGRLLPRFNPIPAKQAEILFSGFGISSQQQYTSPYIQSGFGNDNKTFIKDCPFNTKTAVPDVRGMNAADAVYELSLKDLHVKLIGKGFVKEQTYYSDSKTVVLTLSP